MSKGTLASHSGSISSTKYSARFLPSPDLRHNPQSDDVTFAKRQAQRIIIWSPPVFLKGPSDAVAQR